MSAAGEAVRSGRKARIVALAILGLLVVTAAQSQHEGVTRTDLLRHALGIPGQEVIQVRVDLAPGVAFPPHRHPGAEVAYVLEGEIEYRLGDGPPVILRAGEALFIPAGTMHTARNLGAVSASELATYIVEQDMPLVVFDRPDAPGN